MTIGRTQWEEPNCPNTLGADARSEEQPAFGLKIIWNQPSKPFKPCIILNFWSYVVQVGYLLG